jgi:thiamine monophosphate synthase
VIVGVLSLVTLSVGELPRSEAIARSGVEGVAMIEALITKPVKAIEATELIPLIR